MASRQAERRIEPFQVIWLIIVDLRNCLTKVHSIDGMHPTAAARSALLEPERSSFYDILYSIHDFNN